LLPNAEGKWWTVGSGGSTRSVRTEVLDAIRVYALAAIGDQLKLEPEEG
jgi:hypothetical protein